MSFNKTKTDSALGLAVHAYLLKMGVETPMTDDPFIKEYDRSLKIDIITNRVGFCLVKINYIG
jgi:hypothetical protein